MSSSRKTIPPNGPRSNSDTSVKGWSRSATASAPGQSVVVAGQGALKEGGKIKVLSRQTESAAKPSPAA